MPSEATWSTVSAWPRRATSSSQNGDKGNGDGEWTSAHDAMLDELARKHLVYGSLIPDTEFRIVEALT